jgi:hypothetical protein
MQYTDPPGFMQMTDNGEKFMIRQALYLDGRFGLGHRALKNTFA